MKDNGIKILDLHGGYLRIELEKHFNMIVNEPDLKKAVIDFQTNLAKFFDLTLEKSQKGRALIGRDTRISSPLINDLMKETMVFCNTQIHDFGQQTTP